MRKIPLSVRVSDEDASFLAGLQIADATTPSEKLRALLSSERRRHEGGGDPIDAADLVRDQLRPSKRRIRRMETDAGIRSEFLMKLFDRLPEVTGQAMAGPDPTATDPVSALHDLESRLLDDCFALVHEMLEVGLTRHNRCYDPSAITKRLTQVSELIDVIKMAQQRNVGDT